MFRAEIVIWADFHSHIKVNHVVRAYERCVCLKGTLNFPVKGGTTILF